VANNENLLDNVFRSIKDAKTEIADKEFDGAVEALTSATEQLARAMATFATWTTETVGDLDGRMAQLEQPETQIVAEDAELILDYVRTTLQILEQTLKVQPAKELRALIEQGKQVVALVEGATVPDEEEEDDSATDDDA